VKDVLFWDDLKVYFEIVKIGDNKDSILINIIISRQQGKETEEMSNFVKKNSN